MKPRFLVLLVAAALLAGACGGTDPAAENASPAPAPSGTATQVSVAPASFDLTTGEDVRFIAGVFTPERELIVGGEMQMTFAYLGEEASSDAQLTGEAFATTTASFLPVPGREPQGELETPRLIDAPTATGVYETAVTFEQPGLYGVQVTGRVDDVGQVVSSSTFQVTDEHLVPAVGDDAPAVDNQLVGSDAEPVAIDSRAQDGGEVPDPQLHDRTVADAIAAGEPTVVVLSTPVYCVSRFCGPITEFVEDLEGEYGDRAEFVHIEVWNDFEAKALNPAAAEWIQPESGTGGEPWVFLIGADGTVQARWDNVLDGAELEEMLEELSAT